VPAAGLVVLGGRMGAHDDDEAPWLPATRDLLGAAVADGTPTLGVCLGAQLLAVACGGRVEVGASGIEAGVVDVRWRAEAAQDPLFGGHPSGGSSPGPSMHQDAVVELPPGALWLGETPQYPHQAFRVGSRAWGVQFHPEASPTTFRGWSATHADDWPRWGLDGDEVVAQLERRDEEVVEAGRRLAVRFAALLARE
jgi:GMP synthase (glutamine-hydrolysing)